MAQLSHPYMTTGKTIALTRWTFLGKVMSLLFNMLSRFIIGFLPRSRCLLISCLQLLSDSNCLQLLSVTASTFSPSICHEVMGWMSWSLFFDYWALSQLFHSPLSPSSRDSLVSFHFLPIDKNHLHIWGYWYFSGQSWLWFMWRVIMWNAGLDESHAASGSLPMNQFFASGGQSIGDSGSASILPINIQDWFPLGWTGWIALLSKGFQRVFSNTTVQKHQFFGAQLSL